MSATHGSSKYHLDDDSPAIMVKWEGRWEQLCYLGHTVWTHDYPKTTRYRTMCREQAPASVDAMNRLLVVEDDECVERSSHDTPIKS